MDERIRRLMTPSLNVLVVDDTRAIRWSTTVLLEQLGHRCRMAENGYMGWQLAKSFAPQLIVTDIEMPVWNGFNLIRALRNCGDPKLWQCPIVVCSSQWQRQRLLHAIELGADAFVTKPVRRTELKLAIQNACLCSA